MKKIDKSKFRVSADGRIQHDLTVTLSADPNAYTRWERRAGLGQPRKARIFDIEDAGQTVRHYIYLEKLTPQLFTGGHIREDGELIGMVDCHGVVRDLRGFPVDFLYDHYQW